MTLFRFLLLTSNLVQHPSHRNHSKYQHWVPTFYSDFFPSSIQRAAGGSCEGKRHNFLLQYTINLICNTILHHTFLSKINLLDVLCILYRNTTHFIHSLNLHKIIFLKYTNQNILNYISFHFNNYYYLTDKNLLL